MPKQPSLLKKLDTEHSKLLQKRHSLSEAEIIRFKDLEKQMDDIAKEQNKPIKNRLTHRQPRPPIQPKQPRQQKPAMARPLPSIEELTKSMGKSVISNRIIPSNHGRKVNVFMKGLPIFKPPRLEMILPQRVKPPKQRTRVNKPDRMEVNTQPKPDLADLFNTFGLHASKKEKRLLNQGINSENIIPRKRERRVQVKAPVPKIKSTKNKMDTKGGGCSSCNKYGTNGGSVMSNAFNVIKSPFASFKSFGGRRGGYNQCNEEEEQCQRGGNWNTVEAEIKDNWNTAETGIKDNWNTAETGIKHAYDALIHGGKDQRRHTSRGGGCQQQRGGNWNTVEAEIKDNWNTAETGIKDNWNTAETGIKHAYDALIHGGKGSRRGGCHQCDDETEKYRGGTTSNNVGSELESAFGSLIGGKKKGQGKKPLPKKPLPKKPSKKKGGASSDFLSKLFS